MRHLLLGITNYFVPPENYPRELLIRARLTVFMILLSALMIFLFLVVSLGKEVVDPVQIRKMVIYLILQSLFLFAIKRFRKIEWSAFLYFALTLIVTTIEVAITSKTATHASLQVFPLTVSYASFVLIDGKKRLALLLIGIGLSIWTMTELRNVPLDLQKTLEGVNYSANYILTISGRVFLTLGVMYWLIQIKNGAAEELNNEFERNIRTAKLQEMSSLIQSSLPELKEPTLRIQEILSELSSREGPIKDEDFQDFDKELEHMKQLAAGLSWIYKAYRDDSIGPAPASYLQNQLAVLLKRKLADHNIPLVMTELKKDFTLEGPIPSVFLLHIKLIEDILNEGSLESKEGITVTMEFEQQNVLFHIDFVCARENEPVIGLNEEEFFLSPLSPRIVRKETIRDLIGLVEAEVTERAENFRHRISIQGEWVV